MNPIFIAAASTGMPFFIELAMVVFAALIGSALANLFKQPAILGYILGGLLISPFTWGPSIEDVHHFDEIAEFGVILLMFSIGAEFSPKELANVRKLALIGGPVGILLFILMGSLAGVAMGWGVLKGAVLGAIIASASTMVLGRFLIDRGLMRSKVGRATIGISLVDDLAVVVLIVLLPVFGSLSPDTILHLGIELGRAFLILAPVLFLSYKVIPPLIRKVSRWKNEEFLLVFTLSMSVVAAAFTEWLGLSLALGAFLAGVLLSHSNEGREAVAKLHGLRDLCVAIFFVSVGALIDPRQILAAPGTLMVLLGMIVVGKFAIWMLLIWWLGETKKTALASALYLSQIGEFAFVLSAVALTENLITSADYNAVLAAALLSILANSLLTKRFAATAPQE